MMMLKWYGEGLVKALKSLMEEVLSGRVLGDTNIDGLFALFIRMILVAARAMAPLIDRRDHHRGADQPHSGRSVLQHASASSRTLRRSIPPRA